MKNLPDKFSQEPDKRFIELVVTFSRDIEVLESSSSMEGYMFSLHFPILDVDLITDEADWDSLTYSGEVFVPFLYIFISDP